MTECITCGKPLLKDGPSDDFCIPKGETDCQGAWHRKQATRPAEVDGNYTAALREVNEHPSPASVAAVAAAAHARRHQKTQEGTNDG